MGSSELDGIIKITEPATRLIELRKYIDRGNARLAQARVVRDATIGQVRRTHQLFTRKTVADMAGVSVAHVAAVTGKHGQSGPAS